MTDFNDRERAEEAKFAHDEEMQFRAVARRNRLLGLWAAGLLGKTGSDAAAYAEALVRSDIVKAGGEEVYRRVSADLGDRVPEVEIRTTMVEAVTSSSFTRPMPSRMSMNSPTDS